MADTKEKFCRNCVWSESGWCEWYQQELFIMRFHIDPFHSPLALGP